MVFNSGLGTTKPPQLLEAMSADLGAVQSGFVNNFAYGTISLTANTSVEVVDQSVNTTSGKPEAVYANELIVPAGATLNLNNLHVYVRGDQISGTLVGGMVTLIPVGGSLALNTPTPGTLTPCRRGRRLDVLRDGGRIAHDPAQSGHRRHVAGRLSDPELGPGLAPECRAAARWRRPAAAARARSPASAGSSLPASGTYTIQVQAAAGQSSSTGNYVLSAYDVTANVRALTVNQQEDGTIGNAYGVDQWDFTGSSGQQVQFHVISRQWRRPVRPDRTRQSGAVLRHPGRLGPDHAAGDRPLRADGPRLRRPGRLVRLRAGTDLGDEPVAGGHRQRDAGRQRPGPALHGERALDAVAARQPPGQHHDRRSSSSSPARRAADPASTIQASSSGSHVRPAGARPVGGAGDVVHPGVRRVGPLVQQLQPSRPSGRRSS